MAVAIVGALFDPRNEALGYIWIGVGLLIGSVVGGSMGLRIPMTAVPQRTALSHSLGALAAALVGVAHYVRYSANLNGLEMAPLGFEVIIGGLTLVSGLGRARLPPSLWTPRVGRSLALPNQTASGGPCMRRQATTVG